MNLRSTDSDVSRIGNPKETTVSEVKDVLVARDLEDPRDATITWQPVKGADGYVSKLLPLDELLLAIQRAMRPPSTAAAA